MEAKTECFSIIAQKKVDPRHRSLCVAGVKPGPMLLFLETRPLQQGQRCIPNVMETPKGVCFSTFQPNREGTEQGISGPSSNFADNSSLAQSVVVSTSSTNVNRKLIPIPQEKDLLMGPKLEKHSLIETGKLRLLLWTISGKSYLQKNFKKRYRPYHRCQKTRFNFTLRIGLEKVG